MNTKHKKPTLTKKQRHKLRVQQVRRQKIFLTCLFLLIVGCFLDTVPAIIIIAPMLLPTIQAFNINPIHFGVVMSVNLAVGLCTPPYGCNLFVGAAVAKIKMESMLKWVVPFFLVSCVLLLILSFVPALSLAFV